MKRKMTDTVGRNVVFLNSNSRYPLDDGTWTTWIDANTWANTNCPSYRGWQIVYSTEYMCQFHFDNSNDAAQFKLRWL